MLEFKLSLIQTLLREFEFKLAGLLCFLLASFSETVKPQLVLPGVLQ